MLRLNCLVLDIKPVSKHSIHYTAHFGGLFLENIMYTLTVYMYGKHVTSDPMTLEHAFDIIKSSHDNNFFGYYELKKVS